MRALAIAAALLGVIAASGCGRPQQPTVPAVDVKEVEIRDLKRTVHLLQTENAALAGQGQEVRGRDDLLVSTIRQLQSENRQLLEQVRALAGAPADRDRYRARAEALSAYVLHLEREIERLGGKLPVPPARGATATAPAKERKPE